MLDKSGSCAITSLFVDDVCYIANVGDSRAFMSADGGKYTVALSRDHKPNDELETERITKGGGRIYQTQTVAKVPINNQNGCFTQRGAQPTP
jgi:serine/threonine protein phosphatase PrpC